MEKIVLSNGNEYELIPNAVHPASTNVLMITFKPGDTTVEEMLAIWSDNDTLTVKVDDTSIQVYTGYTECKSVTLTPNYLIGVKYVCPMCGTEVAHDATTCPSCDAAFDAPTMEEIRANVCTVKVGIQDTNTRLTNVEDSVDDIIDSILG